MKQYAEALVECEYKNAEGICLNASDKWALEFGSSGCLPVDPFTDTLEGRRQADALEDWLDLQHSEIWLQSAFAVGPGQGNNRKWRLDRIKWCFEQVELSLKTE